jgi:DNA-binding HxlR family transcriptional regulator
MRILNHQLDSLKYGRYGAEMRSYRQYCAMAKALDVVGDRWTLLVVRELLLRDGLRYTDLLTGLPGIATNLLAERLRDLEGAGLVSREQAPPPVATTLYHLTPRGRALRPVVKALGSWGGPLLASAPEDDAFLGHWLALPAESLLGDRLSPGPPLAIELRAEDGQPVTVEAIDGAVRARPGAADRAGLVISGPHRAIVRLLAGRDGPQEARSAGVTFDGDLDVLERLGPSAATASGT